MTDYGFAGNGDAFSLTKKGNLFHCKSPFPRNYWCPSPVNPSLRNRVKQGEYLLSRLPNIHAYNTDGTGSIWSATLRFPHIPFTLLLLIAPVMLADLFSFKFNGSTRVEVLI